MAGGAPLAGAWIAAVHAVNIEEPTDRETRPAALAQTTAEGRYHLAGLAPGKYAVTLTASSATAYYLGDQDLGAAEAPRELPLQIPDAPSHTLSGTLRDPQGRALGGVEVRALRFSDDVGDIFYTKTDAEGRFLLRLPPAGYLILAFPPGLESESQAVDLAAADQRIELQLYLSPSPATAEVEGWIKAHAVPLRTVEAGPDHSDLAAFSAMVGDATVVSLGEATHGTREFFQLKHRLLEHLVNELGFRVFAIEASMSEAFAVDEYLQTGKGDPARLLSGLYFWTWNTEEVLELIRWMRNYNAQPEHREKLHFYGFDLQFPELALRRALDYLKKVDPSWLPPPVLEQLADPCTDEPNRLPPGAVEAVAQLERRFEDQRTPQIRRSSLPAWEFGRQHARIAAQFVRLEGSGNMNGERDRGMAENVQWIQAREHGAKMVLWAHNAHIADRSYVQKPSMGQWLRAALGPKVLTVGFTFHHGSFRAMETPLETSHGVREFAAAPAAPDSVAAELASLGLDRALLDLRPLAPGSAPRAWFEARRPFDEIGATYQLPPPNEGPLQMRFPVTAAFDVLAFVKEMSAARGLPWGRSRLLPPGKAPLNLDFEEGLEGWFFPDAAPAFDFELSAVDQGAKSGTHAALLRRAPGPRPSAYCARFSQRVEAQAFPGKSVRLKAWVKGQKLRGPAPRLWIATGAGPQAPAARQDVQLHGEGWQLLQVSIQIPEGAPHIAYGLAFSGEGEVLLDGVGLEAP
ncbi:MAG: erythromycin esterase family protein [Myxococcota bacterium]